MIIQEIYYIKKTYKQLEWYRYSGPGIYPVQEYCTAIWALFGSNVLLRVTIGFIQAMIALQIFVISRILSVSTSKNDIKEWRCIHVIADFFSIKRDVMSLWLQCTAQM